MNVPLKVWVERPIPTTGWESRGAPSFRLSQSHPCNGPRRYPGRMDLEAMAGGEVDVNGLEGESLLEATMLKYLRGIYEDPAIITGWVVVAEFVDSKGTPDLHAFATTGMPYWKINGMLEAAPHEIAYSDEDDEDEDD